MTRRPGVGHAAKFFADNHLHLRNVGAVRMSLGARELPEISGFHQSVLVMWRPDRSGLMFHGNSADNRGVVGRVRLSQIREDWTHVRCLQIFLQPDPTYLEPGGGHLTEAGPREGGGHLTEAGPRDTDSRLSPITEEALSRRVAEVQRRVKRLSTCT